MQIGRSEDAVQPQNVGHISALDGIRGFAVSAVFLDHAFAYAKLTADRHSLLNALHRVCSSGWFGVDLFFVLSGFLITTILLDASQAANYYRVFYPRRALRIAPLYYGVLALALWLEPGHTGFGAQIWFWLNFSNLPTAFNPWLIPYLAHFWSLAIEEQFYLVWPTIVRHLRARALAWVSVGTIISLAIVRNLSMVLRANAHFPELVYRLTPFRVDTLCAGALLALIVRRRPQWLERRGWLRVATVAGFGLFLYSGGVYATPAVVRFGYSGLLLGAFGLTALALFQEGWIARIFSHSWLRTVGRYSFAFYLFHPFVLNYLQGNFHCLPFLQRRASEAGFSQNKSLLLLLPLEYAVVLGFSALSWRLYEEPILRWKWHFRYSPRPTHQLV